MLSYCFAVLLMHWNAHPGNIMSWLLILLLPDNPSSFSIFYFDQRHELYTAPCTREIHCNMDTRRNSSGSNTAAVVMVYSYKQDRIFMCSVLFYIFLERNRLISGKHIIFGLYTKYNRFFFCFICYIILINQPNTELVGWPSSEVSICIRYYLRF